MEKEQFEQTVKDIINESFITLVKSKRLKLNQVLTTLDLTNVYFINNDYLDVICKLYIDGLHFESDNDYKDVVKKRNELLQKISKKVKIPKYFKGLSDIEKQIKNDLNKSIEKIIYLCDFLKENIVHAMKTDANNFIFFKFFDKLNLEIKLVLTLNHVYNTNFSENSLLHLKDMNNKILALQEEIQQINRIIK